ncbi:MAG: pyruvate kinase [Candidatus Bathyarchaeota archaeon]|nr:pyruvate kinase [Candidatus Bathyarchaeota archaeon]MDH5745616.1 pyruvate kinase [Candidatus Bathyarchaeota archaeon]
MNKTKIICTIGPASLSRNTLEKMYRAGMNGARINTAYGTLDQYKVIISSLREVADIPIIIDVKGPEIRLKTKGRRTVNKGDVLEVGKDEKISFNNNIYDDVDVGDNVLIDNGRLRTQIVEKQKGLLKLLATTSGIIDDGKGVNIPNKKLAALTLSSKDLEIVDLAKECDAEFIALSFTRNAQDVNNLKKEANGFKGAIIAKIENSEGVDKFNEILDAADGIMVARGDLGVEIEPEKVPLVQKSIIRKCNQRGKTVVTATEMLESMTYQPIPTRAEVSDVANAILDGTEVTMLSGETAVGRYPVESVLIMSKIANETEKAVESHIEDEGFINISDTISKAVPRICQEMPVDKVVTLTRSGYTARMISRFKILQPIIAVTPNKRVKRQLELSFGVYPVYIDYLKEDDRILATANKLHSMGLIDDQDTIIFTAAFRTSKPHSSNLIEVHNIKELIELTEIQHTSSHHNKFTAH